MVMGEVIRTKEGMVKFEFRKEEALYFQNLDIGDKFIAMPLPGDDSGHGGFKQPYWIFIKINEVSHPLSDLKDNAKRLWDGKLSNVTPNMEVIKVA